MNEFFPQCQIEVAPSLFFYIFVDDLFFYSILFCFLTGFNDDDDIYIVYVCVSVFVFVYRYIVNV